MRAELTAAGKETVVYYQYKMKILSSCHLSLNHGGGLFTFILSISDGFLHVFEN